MYKYPKLFVLGCSFILAYALFQEGAFELLPSLFNAHGYISMFLAGLLFSFGFTTPFAIGIFVELSDTVDPVLGALIAGCGALLSDLTIFEIARFSIRDELRRLAGTGWARWLIHSVFNHERLSQRLRLYLLWSIAGIVIASPLPDEIGVTLLSGVSRLNAKQFALLCYAFNTAGIAVILFGARTLG